MTLPAEHRTARIATVPPHNRLFFVNDFQAPDASLAGLGPEAVAALIAAATDVALVLGADGVVRDVAVSDGDLTLEDHRAWIGQRWADTVREDSRAKVEALLRDAVSGKAQKWRHVNHPSAQGGDVPILYAAVRAGGDGRIVAFGRDLRTVAALQQRLVRSQQAMEQDYQRLRHIESRYRMLLERTSEATLVIDAATLKIIEANPAAVQLTGLSQKRLASRQLHECCTAESQAAANELLLGVRATGQSADARARLAPRGQDVTLHVDMLRHEHGSLFLVRLVPAAPTAAASAAAAADATLRALVDQAPDGFVVTDPTGRIVWANTAFLEMSQSAVHAQVQGESLDRWLGRPGVDLRVLLESLDEHGAVRLFATVVRGEYGASTPVEISATQAPGDAPHSLGFTIRDVGRRAEAQEDVAVRQLPRSVAQLKELVGRVPMKDIVAETTDMIEKLCLEAALELTHDNRASAAEMLGLSRQSLYVKLRRYGMGELGFYGDRQAPPRDGSGGDGSGSGGGGGDGGRNEG